MQTARGFHPPTLLSLNSSLFPSPSPAGRGHFYKTPRVELGGHLQHEAEALSSFPPGLLVNVVFIPPAPARPRRSCTTSPTLRGAVVAEGDVGLFGELANNLAEP